MMTIILSLLIFLFCILYALVIGFWIRLRKHETYKSSMKSRTFSLIPVYIALLACTAVVSLFIVDPGFKYRLSLLIIFAVPILSINIKLLYIGNSNRRIHVLQIFCYMTYIALTGIGVLYMM